MGVKVQYKGNTFSYNPEDDSVGAFKYIDGKWRSPLVWAGLSDDLITVLDEVRRLGISQDEIEATND